MTNPRKNYQEAQATLQQAVDRGNITVADADRIRRLCNAFDPDKPDVPLPSEGEYTNDTSFKKATTLRYWMQHLKRVAERLQYEPYETLLTEATAADINDLMADFQMGSHPDIKPGGLANNTIRNAQCCVRRFYRYHTDLAVDADEISLISGDETHLDGQDMLTEEEISRIREAADHPRDLAIFDLLLYTGQRNTAIRSLRINDVNLEKGIYRLNTDADGLKGAHENGVKRPLLGAVGALRDWLQRHPFPNNSDAFLITPKPGYSDPSPDRMVSTNTLQYALKNLKEEADIDKPMNPHSLRHNFVTIAKRVYRMDGSTVKYLIGHPPDSQVMETTYAHLSDEDNLRAAEAAAGIREPQNNSILTPDTCHCGNSLPDDAKACSQCGTVYTPDAQYAKAIIEPALQQALADAELIKQAQYREEVNGLDDLLEIPMVRQALIERLRE